MSRGIRIFCVVAISVGIVLFVLILSALPDAPSTPVTSEDTTEAERQKTNVQLQKFRDKLDAEEKRMEAEAAQDAYIKEIVREAERSVKGRK